VDIVFLLELMLLMALRGAGKRCGGGSRLGRMSLSFMLITEENYDIASGTSTSLYSKRPSSTEDPQS
jgi:hypothetical protein